MSCTVGLDPPYCTDNSNSEVIEHADQEFSDDTCNDKIPQLDGNMSVLSVNNATIPNKPKKHEVALTLPTVGVCNARSLFPKFDNFKTNMIERKTSWD